MHAPRRAYLWMLLGAASFSVMSFLTHTLSGTFSWQTIAVFRAGVALVLTVVLAWTTGAKLVFWRPRALWIRSFAGSVALVANFYAMTHGPISEVLALSNMFPLWVAVLSWPVLGERLRLDAWLAAGCGVIGVWFLVQRPSESTSSFTSVLPVITAVLASFASAIAMLGLHRLKGIDARAIVAHFSGVSTFFSLIALLTLPSFTPLREATSWSVGSLIVLGIAATVGQIFLTKAFAEGPPAQVSVVGLTQVGFSMLLEMIFEQRSFTSSTLLGLTLVVAPTAWVMTRRRVVVEVSQDDEPLEPMSDV
jgi:drug/metabolite transporter (DMT)-like permease